MVAFYSMLLLFSLFLVTVIGKKTFAELHKKRINLQRRKDVAHKLLFRENELKIQFAKWYKKVSKKEKKEKLMYELIRKFCIEDVDGGCSWTEANLLLSHTSGLTEPLIEKNQVKKMLQDWVFPSANMKQSMPTKLKSECKRIKYIPGGLEFLTEYVFKNVPLVIEGGASEWHALQKWDLQYLNKTVSGDIIKLYTSLDGDFEKVQTINEWTKTLEGIVDFDGGDWSQEYIDQDPDEVIMIRPAETEFTFGQFAKIVTEYPNHEHASFYLQKQDIRKWKQLKLIKDISPFLFGPNEQDDFQESKSKSKRNKKNKKINKSTDIGDSPSIIETNGFGFSHFLNLEHFFLWAGLNNTRGPIHYDENENLFAMIKGSKTFELFHPHESEAMYESDASYRSGHLMFDLDLNEKEWKLKFPPETKGDYYAIPASATKTAFQPFSPVNVSHPDLKKHPKFGNAHRVTCKLNAGDILYLPSYWWHEVSTYGAQEDDRLALGVNAFFSPYYKKGSDLKHFSRSDTYNHINHFIDYNIEEIFRMIQDKKYGIDDVRPDEAFHINQHELKKMLKNNYWRTDGKNGSKKKDKKIKTKDRNKKTTIINNKKGKDTITSKVDNQSTSKKKKNKIKKRRIEL